MILWLGGTHLKKKKKRFIYYFAFSLKHAFYFITTYQTISPVHRSKYINCIYISKLILFFSLNLWIDLLKTNIKNFKRTKKEKRKHIRSNSNCEFWNFLQISFLKRCSVLMSDPNCIGIIWHQKAKNFSFDTYWQIFFLKTKIVLLKCQLTFSTQNKECMSQLKQHLFLYLFPW